MTVTDLVTDPSLHAALETSAHTREHCMLMLDSLFRNPSSSSLEDIQAELFKAQKILYAYLSQMRGLNRQAALDVRETKQITAEARQEVDRLHLQLQNLYYEQRHLRGEIAACDAYE
jgi:THO complex subunit 5